MVEQWTRWEPIPNLAPKYSVYVLNFNKKGLRIELMDDEHENKIVEISFKRPVVAYTRTDESFILNLLCDLSNAYGDVFYGYWTFFKVTNSRYIQQISQNLRHTISDSSSLIHFVIMSGNDMVDIVSDYEPEVTMRTWNIKTLMLLYKERIIPIINRFFPTAKIILYGSRARGEIFVQKLGVTPIQIALDAGHTIDPNMIVSLKDTLRHEAAVKVPKNIVDFHAVSEKLRQQIIKEGIDWVKEKNI